MKIALDARLLDTVNNTGISRYIEFLLKYYSCRYRSEDISIISNDKKFTYYNCQVIYTDLKPYNIVHFFLFYFKIRNLKPLLYHAPFYSALAFKSKIKTVVTVHDLMYRIVPNFFSKNFIVNKLKIVYFDFIVRLSLTSANEIVSVSQTTSNDVFNFLKRNSFTIPENSEINVTSDDSILKKFNLVKKSFFLYCGNSRPHKNLNILYKVFETKKDLPLLVMAGKGHRAGTNTLNVGTVSDHELKSLYESAIAFVFPSFYEGFGLPVLESFYSRTIVVASKIPAFLEFESDNIIFFDPDNIEELHIALKDAQGRKFIDNDFLDKFNDKNLIAKYDELLAKI